MMPSRPDPFRELTGATLRWSAWDGAEAGLEHVELSVQRDRTILVRSVVVGTEEERPFGLHYALQLGRDWSVQTLHAFTASEDVSLTLSRDADGRWHDRSGPLPHLDGCTDLDITATPFTNTLPIRRLGLRAGESQELRLVYVAVPTLTVSVARQRYTALEPGRLYRFESLDSGFVADLPVDADGFVLDYPGLFRRRTTQGNAR